MDRRLVVSVFAAVGALATGITAAVLGAAPLSLIAGGTGALAGLCAASFASEHRDCRSRLRAVDDEHQRLRREVSTLNAAMSEESSMQTARQQLTDVDAPEEETPLPAAPDDALDPVSGLLEERFFSVLVYQRVAAARRLLQPVSVVMFEVDSMNDAEPAIRDEAIGVLGEVVRATLRECDTSCRVSTHGAGAVLENTTEAGAVWAVERVRGILLASPVGMNLTISAAVACYPSHALGAGELLERVNRALIVARARGKDHVEVARLD
jgi:diguanylate cyclase (GGDEF)-like protein